MTINLPKDDPSTARYMMDFKQTIFFLTIILTIVLCDDTEIQNPVKNENLNKTDDRNVGDAVNEFGYKLLLTMMRQDKDENVVISPTSIAGLLAMTLLGTVGKTYNELAGALGFSQDVIENRKNHEQFGDLLLQLNSNDSSSKTLYADAMFVDAGAALRTLFRAYLSRVYRGDALNVDFKQSVVGSMEIP
ncbi:Serpin-13 [Operophtera brumata]|uniref:Serpin-13 n=1 Tax=Operophtera brumata TaxID=104452 RepID=A0A0L7KS31_OPEBR|nr:Serpin-13 [Operophtera brumata]